MDGPAPGEVPHERSVQSLTQQPFGQTERISDDQGLRDVAFLDLNASPTVKHKLLSSTDLAKEDTTTTPSSSSSRAVGDSTKLPNERESDEGRHRRNKSQPASRRDPPNPVVASDGENSTMPSVDHTITQFQPQATDKTSTDGLPRIEPGDGEGPDVTYGQDVVLDMDGYHSSDPERPNAADRGGGEIQHSILETFTRDLLAAVPEGRRPGLTLRATDPDFHLPASSDTLDLPLDTDDRELRRSDRAKSEPPTDSPEHLSPKLDPTKTASAMDYAWDWGRIPESSGGPSERRGTLPPMDVSSGESSTRLKNVEENPYLFVFDAEGRTHTFELALNDDNMRPQDAAFLDNRVTFQEFIENPSIVDDPKLVVRYSLQ
jgi:phosphatidate phosphatase LPIN